MSDAADDIDYYRNAFANPQGYCFALVKAQLDGDMDTVNEIFELIERAALWHIVTVVGIAELTEALRELHGDGARAWVIQRLQGGMDPEPE